MSDMAKMYLAVMGMMFTIALLAYSCGLRLGSDEVMESTMSGLEDRRGAREIIHNYVNYGGVSPNVMKAAQKTLLECFEFDTVGELVEDAIENSELGFKHTGLGYSSANEQVESCLMGDDTELILEMRDRKYRLTVQGSKSPWTQMPQPIVHEGYVTIVDYHSAEIRVFRAFDATKNVSMET